MADTGSSITVGEVKEEGYIVHLCKMTLRQTEVKSGSILPPRADSPMQQWYLMNIVRCGLYAEGAVSVS